MHVKYNTYSIDIEFPTKKNVKYKHTLPTDGKRLRDFYRNFTNSIVQQLKILENCRCIVPNFIND